MTDQDVLQKLASLTGRQREILKKVCQGNDYKTIAEDLVISEETVKSHVGNIYVKLGLDQMPVSLRRKAIFETYCPALHETEFTPLPNEPTEPEPVPQAIQKMVNEDDLLILQPLRGEIIDRRKKRRKPRWELVAVLLVVIILAIFGAYNVYEWVNGIIHPAVPVPTSAPAQVYVVVTATQQPAENTPTSLATSVPTPTTPPPTATEVPATSTTIPSPTSAVTFPFSDNFDNGVSPLWQVQSGTWLESNGRYTVLPKETNEEDFDFSLLPSLPSNDYQVSANVYLDSTMGMGQISAILFRIPANGSDYLSLYMDNFTTRFAVIGQDFNHVQTIAEDQGYVVPKGAKVIVDVQGNTFTAKVNGKEILDVTLSGYETGGVGLMDICFSSPPCPSFDNFSVNALP